MKKPILFLTIVITAISSYGQVGDWLLSVDSSHHLSGISTGSGGDVYVGGVTGNSYTASTNTLSVNGNTYTSPNFNRGHSLGFVAKIDSNGNMKWGRMMGTRNLLDFNTIDIITDNNEDVLVRVEFLDTLKIENDTLITLGPTTLPNSNYLDQAIVRFDKNGNFIRAFVLPGKLANYGYYWSHGNKIFELKVDPFNNIYLNYDTAYSGISYVRGSVQKYDVFGNLIHSFSRPYRGAYPGSGFALDPKLNLYLGWTRNNVNSTYSDTILVEYDLLGNLNYALTTQDRAEIEDIEIDRNGNLIAMGFFSDSSLTIGAHTIFAKNQNIMQGFIFKMNVHKHVEWVKALSDCASPTLYQGLSVLSTLNIENDGSILISGAFYKEMCFENETFNAPSLRDSLSIFIYKLNKYGSLIWSTYGIGDGYHMTTGLDKIGENIYLSINWDKGAFQIDDTLHFDTLWDRGTGAGGFIYKLKDGSNFISGQIFVDSNSNSLPNSGDRFFKDQIVSINGTYHTISDQNGLYDVYVDKGNYTLTYPNPKKYHSSNPGSHSASFSSYHKLDTANHFFLTQAQGINDVGVNLVPGFAILRGRSTNWRSKAYLDLYISNDGSSTRSDTCFLWYDSIIGLDTASIKPNITGSGMMGWTYNNLKPYEKRTIHLKFSIANLNFGDTLLYHARIGSLSNDTFPKNNFDSARQIVWRAYDPNNKLVQPEGDVRPEYVKNGNYFNYTIRFQNTGNTPATYVRIRDTISDDLVITSFEMIAASHTYEIDLINPRILDFVFKGINLPDSGANFKESMGFVKFRIKADPTLTHGDFFENTAHIYFDNNEAVATNTTYTEINEFLSVYEFGNQESGIYIFPNPTKSEFRILLNGITQSEVDIILTDLSGRVVFNEQNIKHVNNMLTVSNLNLKPGIYIVEVIQEGEKFNGKIVIQ